MSLSPIAANCFSSAFYQTKGINAVFFSQRDMHRLVFSVIFKTKESIHGWLGKAWVLLVYMDSFFFFEASESNFTVQSGKELQIRNGLAESPDTIRNGRKSNKNFVSFLQCAHCIMHHAYTTTNSTLCLLTRQIFRILVFFLSSANYNFMHVIPIIMSKYGIVKTAKSHLKVRRC